MQRIPLSLILMFLFISVSYSQKTLSLGASIGLSRIEFAFDPDQISHYAGLSKGMEIHYSKNRFNLSLSFNDQSVIQTENRQLGTIVFDNDITNRILAPNAFQETTSILYRQLYLIAGYDILNNKSIEWSLGAGIGYLYGRVTHTRFSAEDDQTRTVVGYQYRKVEEFNFYGQTSFLYNIDSRNKIGVQAFANRTLRQPTASILFRTVITSME